MEPDRHESEGGQIERLFDAYAEALRARPGLSLEEWIAAQTALPGSTARALCELRDGMASMAARLVARRDPSLIPGRPMEPPSGFPAGKRVGRYVLEHFLGSGGMGEVWRAREADGVRLVALKLLLPGRYDAKTLERFTREARVGGRLHHPGIVETLAHGQDDSVAWIALEFVPGSRTLADAITETAGAEDFDHAWYERSARWVRELAEIVEVVHGAGLLHRDLKPSNVLLTPEGRVKLADFGLASARDEVTLTSSGERIGTIAYMSPEQVRGEELDARGDVHGLGAVLYELLTLQRAFVGDSSQELARKITLEDPPDPRTRRSGVPRDLAVIAGKALRKERAKRYATAGEMSADLERFLEHRPIRARPPSRWDRARRWAQRNPGKSSAIVGMASFAGALMIGGGLALGSRLREVAAAELARSTSEEMARSYQFIERMLSHIGPDNLQADQPFDLVKQLEHVYQEQPEASIPWMVDAILARIFQKSGRTDMARRMAERALTEARTRPDASERVLALERCLAHALLDARELYQAEPLLREVLAKVAPDPERQRTRVEVEAELGDLLLLRGDYAGAEPLLQSALAWQARHLDALDLARATTEHALGVLYGQMRRFEAAHDHFSKALQIRQEALGSNHILAFSTIHQTALLLNEEGRFREALDLLEKSLPRFEQVLPPDHPDRLAASGIMADALVQLGHFVRALEIRERNTQIRRALFGDSDQRVLTDRHNLAFCAMRVGQYARALEEFEEVVRQRTSVLGADHALTLTSLGMLAQAAGYLGRTEEALAMAREAYEGLARSPMMGPRHPNALTMLCLQAGFLQDLKRLEESRDVYLEAMALAEEIHPPGHPTLSVLRANLATLSNDLGESDEAERLQVAILDELEGSQRATSAEGVLALSNLAYTRLLQNRPGEALSLLNRGEAIWPADLDRVNPAFLPFHCNMARALMRTGDLDAAAERIALIERADPKQRRLPELKSELTAAREVAGQ